MMVMVLGLGLFVSAQTWSGTWETTFTINPTATTFSSFLGFGSDLEVGYTLGGWDFTVSSGFGAAGFDSFELVAGGVLGAFTFDVDAVFDPMRVVNTETAFTDLAALAAASSPCLQTNSWTYATKTVSNTYTPAFDSLTAEGSVSIAGLSFGGLFYLSGVDNTGSKFYSNYTATEFLTQVDKSGVTTLTLETTLLEVKSSALVGSGAKFTISGSFGGATITNYTYFNLVEYSDWGVSAYDVDHIATKLLMSGVIDDLACAGCGIAFTRNYTLIEGLSPFGDCLTVDVAVDFSCCDFEGLSILFKDIAIGWGVDFDFLVTFTTSSKTMSFEPEFTIAGGDCFTIVAEIAMDGQTIDGINFEGLSYSHVFNGITFAFAATFDYANNPLVGSYGYLSNYSNSELHFWKPDVNATDNTTVAATGAITSAGLGSWTMVDIACAYDRAYVKNEISLDYASDACCGGAFSFSIDTYFGDIYTYTLDAVYGTYYWDANNDGAFLGSEEVIEFLGADWGYADYVALTDVTSTEPLATNTSVSTDPCVLCAAADGIAESSKLVGHYTKTASSAGSLFGWVESDVEVSMGLGSNFTFTLGLDVAWYGWGEFSVGLEFAF